MKTSQRIQALAASLFLLAATPADSKQLDHNKAVDASLQDKATYVVVVHPKNTLKGDNSKLKKIIKQLFLKDRGDWPKAIDGKKKVRPLGRQDSSDEQKAFMSVVLGMSSAELDKHWLSVKQRSGKTAPRSVKKDRTLIKFVSKYPDAFGVLTEAAAKKAGSKVKILFTFQK